MFTIKYRTYVLSPKQPNIQDDPPFYDAVETIQGPFELIQQDVDSSGYPIVWAHKTEEAPGQQFGPIQEDSAGRPRPTLWVMNESGATVAKYDL